MDPAVAVLIPVGIGVVAGVVLVGNLLKWLFHRYQNPTLGILLGLLLGSVFGLWPFQQGVPPKIGDTIKAQIVTTDTVDRIDKEDWPIEYFSPGQWHEVGGSIL